MAKLPWPVLNIRCGSEAIQIWMLYFEWLQKQRYECFDFPQPAPPPLPTTGSPSPFCTLHPFSMVELPK